jgi:hypothetical protein
MKEHIESLNQWVSENYPHAKTLSEIDFTSYPYWEAVGDTLAIETKHKPIKDWEPEQKLEILYLLAREEIGILICWLSSKNGLFSNVFHFTIEDIEDLLVTFPQKWNDTDYESAFAKLVSMLSKGKTLNEISENLLALIEQYYKEVLVGTWGKHTAFSILLSWDDAFYKKYINQILLEETSDIDYPLSLLHYYENDWLMIERYIASIDLKNATPYIQQKIQKKIAYLKRVNTPENE